MTVRVLVACDGNHMDRPDMALEACRGFLPVGTELAASVQGGPRVVAALHDWTQDGERDLCPSCSRVRSARPAVQA